MTSSDRRPPHISRPSSVDSFSYPTRNDTRILPCIFAAAFDSEAGSATGQKTAALSCTYVGAHTQLDIRSLRRKQSTAMDQFCTLTPTAVASTPLAVARGKAGSSTDARAPCPRGASTLQDPRSAGGSSPIQSRDPVKMAMLLRTRVEGLLQLSTSPLPARRLLITGTTTCPHIYKVR